jgi:hypothetical protein
MCGPQGLSVHAGVPAPSAAASWVPVCRRIAEITATSVSTVAGGGVLDAVAILLRCADAVSACASDGVWGGTVRYVGCGRGGGTAGVAARAIA